LASRRRVLGSWAGFLTEGSLARRCVFASPGSERIHLPGSAGGVRMRCTHHSGGTVRGSHPLPFSPASCGAPRRFRNQSDGTARPSQTRKYVWSANFSWRNRPAVDSSLKHSAPNDLGRGARVASHAKLRTQSASARPLVSITNGSSSNPASGTAPTQNNTLSADASASAPRLAMPPTRNGPTAAMTRPAL
jgi:hypothetical protein